jgi:cell division protein ZapD
MSQDTTGTTNTLESEQVFFEQPLSERMRNFLRLDFLYSQALYHHEAGSSLGSRAAMDSLLDIMAITTRGDVRADVLKELERNLAQLQGYHDRPGINSDRLRVVTSNLARLRTELSGTGTGWLQPLRDSEFLASIKHRSAIPGGTCEFDLPDYGYWLNHAAAQRTAAFAKWMGLLRPLCDAVAELLWLLRQNGRTRNEVARSGMFNVNFERDTPFQLLRIAVPAARNLYPEISGSQLRCCIRFMEWRSIDERPKQAADDLPFTLICCT